MFVFSQVLNVSLEMVRVPKSKERLKVPDAELNMRSPADLYDTTCGLFDSSFWRAEETYFVHPSLQDRQAQLRRWVCSILLVLSCRVRVLKHSVTSSNNMAKWKIRWISWKLRTKYTTTAWWWPCLPDWISLSIVYHWHSPMLPHLRENQATCHRISLSLEDHGIKRRASNRSHWCPPATTSSDFPAKEVR